MSVEPPLMRDVLNGVLNSRVDASGLFSSFPATQLTPAEQTYFLSSGILPTNFAFPPGYPRRFGAIGNGVADDTVPTQSAINTCDTYTGWPGDIYGVTSVRFPLGGPHLGNFNGSIIRGIATVATDCVVKLEMEGTTFMRYNVDGNFSQNYRCGTWWYNSVASSQYNDVYGMKHTYFGGVQTASGITVRAMVYGAVPGSTGVFVLSGAPGAGSTSATFSGPFSGPTDFYLISFSNGDIRTCTLTNASTAITWSGGLAAGAGTTVSVSSTAGAQSENQIYGWRTRGCQNPYYNNHSNGVVFFNNPIFVSVAEEWPGGSLTPSAPWSYANARTIQNVGGSIIAQGGEMQLATAGSTFAAELQGIFWEGAFIEVSVPVKITGDAVRFSGGRFFQAALQPCFTIASGATGVLAINDMYLTRLPGVGAFDNNPMIDASANASIFEVILSDTQSFEYRWIGSGADVRLVLPGALTTVRYKNHRMSMTAADANVFMLNTSPTDSMYEAVAFDRLGYTTNGWTLINFFGGGTTMTVTTVAGPTGYLASQITLHATGIAQATFGDPSTLATLKATALHVRPGELFWTAAWCNISAGTTAALIGDFYDLTGAAVSVGTVADQTVIGTGAWKYVEGPLVAPATAAYVCVGVRANVSDVRITDLRNRRAN